MKIEPEVAFALFGAVDSVRSAQDRGPPSIDRLDSSGRGGCGSLFDCEHFQFIDEEDGDEETPSEAAEGGGPAPLSPATLRPALRGAGPAPPRRRRVTFDEAVTLYADGGPRTLALTTGPDPCGAAEVFCTFEPPDEYRDVPPFEPPAEYRDSEETPPPPPPADEEKEPEQPPPPKGEDDREAPRESDASKESDKLFERFLEAEREFAVDDELNSVFHALEEDFGGGGGGDKNGALDDNFFRKLIHLLSSAEAADPLSSAAQLAEEGEDRKTEEEEEEEEGGQAPSRTLSEADSDCSISSQDTIIVRLGEEQQAPAEVALEEPVPEEDRRESYDEVFGESSADAEEKTTKPPPKCTAPAPAVVAGKGGEESLSRQSSGEQSVASQDPPQDADDSTSSDSRSGEVEEEIRLDDIGYDEEDAEDYDEESFRGMAHGNSKIRRIIKKNALQCTLFRGMEAKRRQQQQQQQQPGGAKYPRPKSPLLSQESLVEKLKWLTTIDESGKDADEQQQQQHFRSKPPDVILSTGGVHGSSSSLPHSASSEDDLRAYHHQHHPHFYAPVQQQRQPGYYVRHPASLPRQRTGFSAPPVQMVQHATTATLPHRVPPLHAQWAEQQQQQQRTMTVPRNFRDWRVIQRSRPAHVPADHVRTYAPPPDVAAPPPLQQQQDSSRKRYGAAENDEDDPTFGFARRPSVRGVQQPHHLEDQRHPAYGGGAPWGPAYAPPPHRASVAGNATLPYAHRRPPQDPRYHSYAESVYGPWAPPLLLHERGVPEGASSSPKISSDSMYHSAVPDSCGAPQGPPHKEDGVIYYSLNV